MSKLILNSHGINTSIGTKLIKNCLEDMGIHSLVDSRIFAISLPDYGLDKVIKDNLVSIGFLPEKIALSSEIEVMDDLESPDYIYCTEGNTFEILWYLQRKGLMEYIRDIMLAPTSSAIYIGSSAGACISGSDCMLMTDFDTNIVGRMDMTGLRLLDGAVLPHCTSEQLACYVSNKESHVLNRYSHIYSIGDEEVLVIEI